ncbi:0fac4995-327d-49e3-92d4-3d437b023bb1 [Thermothielavioides terrestris]|uniref:0fac4995-327d-49e3-92d4-3d437b023bb1 n=1 Tax=Thermothielavioides terrestris TaxID=2587410 RepID=A0A3S4F0S4_9PEZI|nr:0fac4995-327d-49e3-92d4-3d437b023bb1 [Thermothielavioides terrestris]
MEFAPEPPLTGAVKA